MAFFTFCTHLDVTKCSKFLPTIGVIRVMLNHPCRVPAGYYIFSVFLSLPLCHVFVFAIGLLYLKRISPASFLLLNYDSLASTSRNAENLSQYDPVCWMGCKT